MNDNRLQHLSEAFNSIISMMLSALRARGLRGILDLPNTIMAAIYLRRLGRQFAALIASIDLDNLPPPAPVPPAPQAAPAQPDGAPRTRHLLAVPPAAPANTGRAHRARQAAVAQPLSAAPKPPARRTRTRKIPRHRVPRLPAFARTLRALQPRAIASLPQALRDTRLHKIGRMP